MGAGSHAAAVVLCLGMVVAAQLMGVLAKLALSEVPAFTFVWLQLAAACGFMLVYTTVWSRERWPVGLQGADWSAIGFIGVVNFGVVRLLMMMAIERLPVNTFVFLMSFVGLATMGLSVVFLKERPGRAQLIGLFLAIAGVWLFFPRIPAPDEQLGLLYTLVIILGLAANNNVTRWLMTRHAGALSGAHLAAIALPLGGVPTILAGLALDWPPPVGGVRNGLIILANGVVGIALTQTVFNAVLKSLRSYEASVLAGSGIVWTALFAIPILGERLEPRQLGAIAVVMGGVLLAQSRPRPAL